MTASLRVCGMCPHTKEALTIFNSGVPITGNSSFRSFVGIGSRSVGLHTFYWLFFLLYILNLQYLTVLIPNS